MATRSLSVTVKLGRAQAEALELLVESGVYVSRAAAAAALLSRNLSPSVVRRLRLLSKLRRVKPRKVNVEELWRDLERAEAEAAGTR